MPGTILNILLILIDLFNLLILIDYINCDLILR